MQLCLFIQTFCCIIKNIENLTNTDYYGKCERPKLSQFSNHYSKFLVQSPITHPEQAKRGILFTNGEMIKQVLTAITIANTVAWELQDITENITF